MRTGQHSWSSIPTLFLQLNLFFFLSSAKADSTTWCEQVQSQVSERPNFSQPGPGLPLRSLCPRSAARGGGQPAAPRRRCHEAARWALLRKLPSRGSTEPLRRPLLLPIPGAGGGRIASRATELAWPALPPIPALCPGPRPPQLFPEGRPSSTPNLRPQRPAGPGATREEASRSPSRHYRARGWSRTARPALTGELERTDRRR